MKKCNSIGGSSNWTNLSKELTLIERYPKQSTREVTWSSMLPWNCCTPVSIFFNVNLGKFILGKWIRGCRNYSRKKYHRYRYSKIKLIKAVPVAITTLVKTRLGQIVATSIPHQAKWVTWVTFIMRKKTIRMNKILRFLPSI